VKEINNDITIWDHYSANSGTGYLLKLDNPALRGRKKGTTVWGFLVIIALFILYQGVRYRPYESLRKNFIKQMKSLYKHRKRALKKAGGRASEISQEDTRRRINDFYEQARSILFNAYKEEPTSLYRYSRVIFIVVLMVCILLLLMMLITTSLKVKTDDHGSVFAKLEVRAKINYGFHKEIQNDSAVDQS
jgi:Na+/melibiose symporter-like transporter